MTARPRQLRAGAPSAIQSQRFGPLTELAGTWVGKGFTLVSKPGFSVKPRLPFVLQVNATIETLTFTPIGGEIPDRGSQQPDINVFGMTYSHEVSDAASLELLHVESGMWLNVPATSTPKQPPTIVRLSTIPHGNAMLAQGNATHVKGRPEIASVHTQPFFADTKKKVSFFPPRPFEPPHVNPFPLPAGFDLADPTAALRGAIKGQNITRTELLQVSSAANNTLNIPFVLNNAAASSLDAVFMIETVKPPAGAGDPFLQLQYSQSVMLTFPPARGAITAKNPLINWPHVSVATLVKQ